MDLILQSLKPISLEQVTLLSVQVQPEQIVSVTDKVWRCTKISVNDSTSTRMAEAAYQAGVDYAFSDNKVLSDFKLLAMDMDSTLINIECINEIADMQGLKAQVSEITEAAMRGELEFKESLARRVALLKGLDVSALEQVYTERLQLNPGAEQLLEAARKAGLKTLLISGGFTFFTERLKDRLELDYIRANTLESQDQILTGTVLGEVVDASVKRRTIEDVCAENGFSPSQAIVMGDGANDLEMMSIAGLSVAYRAKPVVRAKADVALNFVGLDGLLNILS